jgi:leucyl/phenylalanyl-tRNA--protein transferase
MCRAVSGSFARAPFEITVNRAFPAVIAACATEGRRGRQRWITPAFIAAYTELHHAGHAHSVECWAEGRLVGGIYGVAVGGLFAGESMFHRVSNASKVALVELVGRLRQRGFRLFDIQMVTPVTQQLGAVQIPRDEYLRRLRLALEVSARFDGEPVEPRKS